MEKIQTERRRKPRPKTSAEAVAERIRQTLLLFGGEAHRREVIMQMARDAGVDVRNIPEELETTVITSFEAAWNDAQKRETFGFTLRFGEGSHRWGVRMPETAH